MEFYKFIKIFLLYIFKTVFFYQFFSHPKADTIFNPGDKVLLKNLRKNDKKGGWSLMPWIGPFVSESLSDKNTCGFREGNSILRIKQHLKNSTNAAKKFMLMNL